MNIRNTFTKMGDKNHELEFAGKVGKRASKTRLSQSELRPLCPSSNPVHMREIRNHAIAASSDISKTRLPLSWVDAKPRLSGCSNAWRTGSNTRPWERNRGACAQTARSAVGLRGPVSVVDDNQQVVGALSVVGF